MFHLIWVLQVLLEHLKALLNLGMIHLLRQSLKFRAIHELPGQFMNCPYSKSATFESA